MTHLEIELPDDVYHWLEVRALVENCLTPENEIWERFCDESSHLWADN
jgi:hypothetical protein